MKISLDYQNFRVFSSPAHVQLDLSSDIIAFVGANNSGKSCILRSFYELRPVFKALASVQALSKMGNVTAKPETLDPSELLNATNSDPFTLTISIDNVTPLTQYPPGEPFVLKQIRITYMRDTDFSKPRIDMLINGSWLPPATFTRNDELGVLTLGNTSIFVDSMITALKFLADSVYIGPFRNVLELKLANDAPAYFDLSISSKFISSWSGAQTSGRTGIDITQKVIADIERIFGIARFDLTADVTSNILMSSVNHTKYRVTELGAGLSQFISVLFAVVSHRPSLLLIDEPELNLHPRLQLDFLTTIASYCKKTLFATHSFGLARSAADVIYSVHRPKLDIPATIKPVDEISNYAEQLGELSYAGNYDLGYRKILLVEGSTDVKTFQQFLRKLSADHEITIVSLGGSSAINARAWNLLSELRRLNQNPNTIFAIIDSDRESEGMRPRSDILAFAKNCCRLGIRCHILDRRCTESYFSASAITEVNDPAARLLDHFEKPVDWPKTKNWRFAQAMSLDDINNTDLGVFLAELTAP